MKLWLAQDGFMSFNGVFTTKEKAISALTKFWEEDYSDEFELDEFLDTYNFTEITVDKLELIW